MEELRFVRNTTAVWNSLEHVGNVPLTPKDQEVKWNGNRSIIQPQVMTRDRRVVYNYIYIEASKYV